jgi:diguanylate cyclase (GGDEF)-like protein
MVDFNIECRGRALLMDDDPARSARRCGQLTAAGWRMLRCADPAEALAAVRGSEVDVVLLHVPADEAQAMDLPRVFRLACETPHLPVVVVAPDLPEQQRCQFLDSGADEIVSDAVSSAELAARMRALWRPKALQDELRSSRAALSVSLERERELLAQLRRDHARLLTLCSLDPLTQLQNVRHFDSFLQDEFRVSRRYGRRLSVLMLDLDHFKLINDDYGHPTGDHVLKEFAVILRQLVRDSDVAARTGGEEFGVIMPHAGRFQARRLAQRIRRAVADHCFEVFGRQVRVTVSIGSASYPQDAEITQPHMLVYFADQALLHSKRSGRNRVTSFHQLDQPAKAQLYGRYHAACPARVNSVADPALAADAQR